MARKSKSQNEMVFIMEGIEPTMGSKDAVGVTHKLTLDWECPMRCWGMLPLVFK